MLVVHFLSAQLLLAHPVLPTPAPSAACPPAGMTRGDLAQLRQSGFEVGPAGDRDGLAVRLLSCLDDPDPAIRDGVVFEALSTWLRKKALSPPTILALGESLRGTLSGEPDANGFRLPFAALILSEVARADRIDPVFTDAARAELVEVAASSLARVRDYRGFDPVFGWRHGVAHGADLVLQLGVNPKVGGDGVRRLMEALATQIAPEGAVFYTFGEPGRLARAVIFTYRRGLLDDAYWEAWMARISSPAPLAKWGAAFLSGEGLARRHNTIAFLQALSFAGRVGDDEAGKAIAALADRALIQIMSGE